MVGRVVGRVHEKPEVRRRRSQQQAQEAAQHRENIVTGTAEWGPEVFGGGGSGVGVERYDGSYTTSSSGEDAHSDDSRHEVGEDGGLPHERWVFFLNNFLDLVPTFGIFRGVFVGSGIGGSSVVVVLWSTLSGSGPVIISNDVVV